MRIAFLASTLMIVPVPAIAATSVAADEIVVTAARDGYAAKRSATATKTDTDLILIPQSVSVVTAKQIRDQAMHSIGDVLRTVPGVSLNAAEGHRDHIVMRGNSTTADFFADGLRDDVQYYRGLYNIDRVEILKGPNAMIFGRGGGGGVVNRVTKRAEPSAFARFALSGDNEGAADVSADINTPLTTTLAARLNAVAERFASFRNAYGGHCIAVNPTIAWRPDKNTRLDLGIEYGRDTRVIDRGIPSAGSGTLAAPARPLTGYDSVYFGQLDTNRTRFTGKVATAAFEHRFSPTLRVVAKGLAGTYDKFYRNALAATPVAITGGVAMVGIEAYESSTRRRSQFG